MKNDLHKLTEVNKRSGKEVTELNNRVETLTQEINISKQNDKAERLANELERFKKQNADEDKKHREEISKVKKQLEETNTRLKTEKKENRRLQTQNEPLTIKNKELEETVKKQKEEVKKGKTTAFNEAKLLKEALEQKNNEIENLKKQLELLSTKQPNETQALPPVVEAVATLPTIESDPTESEHSPPPATSSFGNFIGADGSSLPLNVTSTDPSAPAENPKSVVDPQTSGTNRKGPA
jgi:chromosome segregation ATPase